MAGYPEALDKDAITDALTKGLRECGEILHLNPTASKRSGRPYTQITFRTEEGVTNAVALNGCTMAGGKLIISKAHPRGS